MGSEPADRLDDGDFLLSHPHHGWADVSLETALGSSVNRGIPWRAGGGRWLGQLAKAGRSG